MISRRKIWTFISGVAALPFVAIKSNAWGTSVSHPHVIDAPNAVFYGQDKVIAAGLLALERQRILNSLVEREIKNNNGKNVDWKTDPLCVEWMRMSRHFDDEMLRLLPMKEVA